jgi:hypothetical protein
MDGPASGAACLDDPAGGADEAENRLHAQKGLLTWLLRGDR